jgi:hypothetical protein
MKQLFKDHKKLVNEAKGLSLDSDISLMSCYDKVDQIINIDRYHKHPHYGKITTRNFVAEYINKNINVKDTLAQYHKGKRVKELLNLFNFAKSGKLPFSSFTYLAKYAASSKTEKVKGKSVRNYFLNSNFNNESIKELEDYCKGKASVDGIGFNEKVSLNVPKLKTNSQKSEIEKIIDADLQNTKRLKKYIEIEKDNLKVDDLEELISSQKAKSALLGKVIKSLKSEEKKPVATKIKKAS